MLGDLRRWFKKKWQVQHQNRTNKKYQETVVIDHNIIPADFSADACESFFVF
jgi:hypothetical protein